MPHAIIWMNTKGIMLSQISQSQKDTYCMIPVHEVSKGVKFSKTENRKASTTGYFYLLLLSMYIFPSAISYICMLGFLNLCPVTLSFKLSLFLYFCLSICNKNDWCPPSHPLGQSLMSNAAAMDSAMCAQTCLVLSSCPLQPLPTV